MGEPNCRLDRVELFEDRGALHYVASVTEGRTTLRFGPVSPLVDPERVTAPRDPEDAAWSLEDVRVEREAVTERELDDEVQSRLRIDLALHERLEREARDAYELADVRRERAMATLRIAQEATPASVLNNEPIDGWIDTLKLLSKNARSAAIQADDARQSLEEASEETERLKSALQIASRGRVVQRAWLVAEVLATTPGRIRLKAVVPCAMWRPVHRATLTSRERGDEADQVHWEVRAALWNATGIPWTDVPIVCSTARPGQRADAPLLTDDRVSTVPRSGGIVVEARETSIDVARHEAPGAAASAAPGVDDGGRVRTYSTSHPVDVPSDGMPVFVTLATGTSVAELAWRAQPESSNHLILRTSCRNPDTRPLLAGPVELVRDGESVGRTTVGFVPPGEPFQLGWGSHDSVRIRRTSEHDVQVKKLTGTQTHTFEVEIHVSNTGSTTVRMEIDERIPTSELKQVSVALEHCEPHLRPDGDGMLCWSIEVPPESHRVLSFRYSVVASSSVQLPF